MRIIKEIKKEERMTWDKVLHHRISSPSAKREYLKMVKDPELKRFKKSIKDQFKDLFKEQKEIENKYGLKNLGPYSDYELGKLEGRYDTLSWVLDEWGQQDN